MMYVLNKKIKSTTTYCICALCYLHFVMSREVIELFDLAWYDSTK